MSNVAVIGAGFSGLSAAAYLSKMGHEVKVFEKNTTIGGRARQLKTPEGYVFDMGPSWYWMPDVFEQFFHDFNKKVSDFYDLLQLDPGFEIVFENKELLAIPADMTRLKALVENLEKGGSVKLQKFMDDAGLKYDRAMKKLVYLPANSWTEFMSPDILGDAVRLKIFSNFSKHVRKHFSHPKLIALMEFPVLFLGAMPQETPALYSLMNYAGLKLGTWYPKGGFGKVIEAMAQTAAAEGAKIYCQSEISRIELAGDEARTLHVNGVKLEFDAVIASADYHHVEHQLLPERSRGYDEQYWSKKTFAPSCLIYYLGFKKRISNLKHHTLFFDEDLYTHSVEIYKTPSWPSRPLFYACCPSKTDDQVAPSGHENLFLLMPLAPGLPDTDEVREQYFKLMIGRLENHTGETGLSEHIDYKKSYCVTDFVNDYHSYKGNAYGLANTLWQSAFFKPKMKSKKVKNLFFTGQLTVPGPGVPPSIISGKIAAGLADSYLRKKRL